MPSPHPSRPRLLVFIVAYQAETTLRAVLDRIPRSVFEVFDTEILVVDDASVDRTYEIGRIYQERHPDFPLTVLRNAHNQGYGGNQKLGYAYAIAQRFDIVAMVHGDGQYAPEELPRLLQPLHQGRADAVFGSRMMPPSGALKGGMPPTPTTSTSTPKLSSNWSTAVPAYWSFRFLPTTGMKSLALTASLTLGM
jgi:glycosyltransferase involved in cell wall biosynthesis